MEEYSNNSPSIIRIPDSSIHAAELSIQARLDNFETEFSDAVFLETSNICENVRDQILYHEDESPLSKTQNNCRRIFIASDLLVSICSIYGHIVDNEFTKIINELMQWEKYKKLSRKIMYKMQLETKKEKYFAKEAESKLLKSSKDAESWILEEKETETEGRESSQRLQGDFEAVPEARQSSEQITTTVEAVEQILLPMNGKETAEAEPLLNDKEIPTVGTGPAETLEEAIHVYDNNEILPPPLESSRDDILSTFSGNLTEMRAEPVTDTSQMQYPISNASRQDFSLPETLAETSIREPIILDKTDEELQHIIQILEDQNFYEEVGGIPQPTESTEKVLEDLEEVGVIPQMMESTNIIPEAQEGAAVEDLQTNGEIRTEGLERSEEWSLPSLEPVEETRSRKHLIIDKVTAIPEYAARALQLNRNINIQRVQVFEGPPKILQGISVNYLMKTPGFKNSLFQDVRSSKLSALYSRHLRLEKKPVEPVLQKRVKEKNRDNVSKVRVTTDIIEEVRERAGMRSAIDKSDVITDILPEKRRLTELVTEIPAVEAPPRESLIDLPVSRIIDSTIEPQEKARVERINGAPNLPTPRVQQLQGKNLDPKASSAWFFSSNQSPPSGKYKEYDYIQKRLLQYWSMFEIQGMEKCITLREFFAFEKDLNVANYLTALRIIDKLSIQRKLLLEFKNNDVIIRPFESPYASDEHLLLKGSEPLL